MGDFPTECPQNSINPEIKDETNVHNKFQDHIRYGFFDYVEFLCRVYVDAAIAKSIISNINTSLLITHLNYTNNDICGNCTIKDLCKDFDSVYLSNTKYAEDIINKEGDDNG